ncbi:MAG: PQQ-binding-like beta-propeller repeat protein [Sedimentisphaerales bacterium]|nr:PQQ-binding-like beta-propeller repeat protein [Sedimentisphaerales bacterium]
MTASRFGRLTAVCVVFLVCGGAAAEWPEFRGPWGNGLASQVGDSNKIGLPLRWSESENVKWKTAIPHRGWSTPVVFEGKIWLTTATADGREFFVICADADTGRIRLNKRLFTSSNPEPLGNDVNCYGSPSCAVEAGRVYVHFGSYGTACLDTESGEVAWERTDLPCRHYRGPGSSVILFGDYLIVTMDGVDVQYVAALDKKTGRTVWKTDRTADWNDLDGDGKPFSEGDLRKAYSTPLVIDFDGGKQMLSAGAKAAYCYDPATGEELWKISYGCYSGASRPLFGNGLAYINTGFPRPEIWAVRLGGRGDVTDTHVVWKRRQAVPQIPSAVVAGELLFMVSDSGAATCLDAVTGEEVWREHLRGRFAASLLYADGRIYCFDKEGKTFVFAAGREFELLAENKLDSGFMASPAVSGGSLILRTVSDLYRIEKPQGQ